MITPKEYPSKKVLQRIADDYRRRGYEVSIAPTGNDLPGFLSHDTPDIIAHRGDEHLVIEVKHSPKDVDPVQLRAIADRIESEPGWRYVVLATPEAAREQQSLQTVDEQTVRRQLKESQLLLDSRHPEAALMLVWAATEAVLRLLVTRHHLRITRGDAASLIRLLASEGLIGEDAFGQLIDGLELRRSVAHGSRALSMDSADEAAKVTRTLASLSEGLLRDLAVA